MESVSASDIFLLASTFASHALVINVGSPYEMNEAAAHHLQVWGAASGKYIEDLQKDYEFYVDYLGSGTGHGEASKVPEERLQAAIVPHT